MKILLDEQVHKLFKDALNIEAEIYKIEDMGWKSLSNGKLREKLNENAFDFLIAADKNIPFQQNIQKMNFSIILMDTPSLRAGIQTLFIPKITAFLQKPPSTLPKLIHVSISEWHNTKLIDSLLKIIPPDQILFI